MKEREILKPEDMPKNENEDKHFISDTEELPNNKE